MSIRLRLALWFVSILFVILAISGVAANFLLLRYLYQEVDNNLTIHSARTHGTLNTAVIPDPLDYRVVHDIMPEVNEFASPGIYIQVIDREGRAVVKSDNLGSQELPVSTFLLENGFNGRVSIATVLSRDGSRVRILASPLYLKDETLLLEVAQSLKFVDDTVNRVRWAILISIVMALFLAGISGSILVGRTLSPVKSITRTAQDIEASSDLSRRVGYTGPPDEVGELASTFDRLIEHLEKSFEVQERFVTDASHDLRSPLTVIRGNLDLLKRNLSEEERSESLKAIESETRRMSRLVDDLLLLAEVESGHAQQEDVNLREIVTEEFKRVGPLAGARTVTIGHTEDLKIKGDAFKLRQMLGNLLDNAIRYTPEGGRISVSLTREGSFARLEVSDNGIGISKEHLPHLFERFYSVDKARSRVNGSTGLGLAIVKGIAEQHGGSVAVSSEPGKGSTFIVRLRLQSLS